jgi:hypothetical protein
VGVALDSQAALLVVDDVGNTVWRVTSTPRANGSHPEGDLQKNYYPSSRPNQNVPLGQGRVPLQPGLDFPHGSAPNILALASFSSSIWEALKANEVGSAVNGKIM